jgi:hypothetical protein
VYDGAIRRSTARVALRFAFPADDCSFMIVDVRRRVGVRFRALRDAPATGMIVSDRSAPAN